MTEPRRITDAAATPNAADVGYLTSIRPEYPSVNAWSIDGWHNLLVTSSGYYRLHDGNGLYLEDLPFDITMGAQPRWSRKIPALLYYLLGNQIRSYDVDSRESAPVRTFPEYVSIDSKGESDISPDGLMVLLGTTTEERQEVFTFNLETGAKGATRDVTGNPVESLYLSADNNVLVSAIGMDLFDSDMDHLHNIATVNAHKVMARDANGNAVLVWCCSNDKVFNCNGIVLTWLADGSSKFIDKLSWRLGMHFAAAPDQPGFVYVSTYHDPNADLSKRIAPTEFDDAILRVALDGSGITKLADTGSVGDSYESGQPRASCSRDGSRIVWGSNQGGAVVDTFLVDIAADSPRTRKPSKSGKKRRGR